MVFCDINTDCNDWIKQKHQVLFNNLYYCMVCNT